MQRNRGKRLGDLLVEAGKITKDQLENALRKQKEQGKKLGEILIEEGLVEEDDIMCEIENQLDIKRVNLNGIHLEESAIKLVPEKLATRHNLIPVKVDNGILYVAMQDPLNIFATYDVEIISRLTVKPMIATSKEIAAAINKYYSKDVVKKASDALTKEQSIIKNDSLNLEDFEVNNIKDAPVVKLVDSIIENAVKMRSSDIHIEPYAKFIKIRYRIDGILKEVLTSPIENLPSLVTRMKILSNLNIAEKRLPQDGRILTKVENKVIDLRVSTLPTIHGEKIAIRVLDKNNFLLKKDKLGFNEEEMKILIDILTNSNGIILISGPTGSGKTTTLYTLLNDLNKEDMNIVSVEDPVELVIDGINQIAVNNKAGLNFASALRAILRQDPDTIMVGEIRDKETVEIAIRAAVTGHLVLSTIHTNDAPSSIIRLIDMGSEPYLIASSLRGVISQRLVRKICPYCIEEYLANSSEKKILNINKDKEISLAKGKGCPYCNETGYIGRVGIYEIMKVHENIRDEISKETNIDSLRKIAIKSGMTSLREKGAEKVINHITTIDEFLRVCYLLD